MRSREERLAEYMRISALLPQAQERLKNIAGIRDIGVGLKETNDLATEEIVFRVYVDKKKPRAELADDEVIPTEIAGVKTDVLLEPTPLLIVDGASYRPLQGGIMIGNDSSSEWGTLGAIARLNSDGTIVMLSCNHVMLAGQGAQIGELIGQPEISCCCCCKGNIVGTVVNAVNNVFVDCAIARITGNPGFTNEVAEIGAILGSATANASGATVVINDHVMKRGASTTFTTGVVANPNKSIGGKAQQIEIKPDPKYKQFAYKGDSGSVLLDPNGIVVGLIWSIDAATQTLAYANYITNVVAALGITIIPSGTPGTIMLGGSAVSDEPSTLEDASQPLDSVVLGLEESEIGRSVLAFFRAHQREINGLLKTNRNVKVAWNRFQGPAFTAHLVKSARQTGHTIPADLDGVSPANLLIRMSVVLQEEGSAELASAVDRFTLPLLNLIDGARSAAELVERARRADEQADTLVRA